MSRRNLQFWVTLTLKKQNTNKKTNKQEKQKKNDKTLQN